MAQRRNLTGYGMDIPGVNPGGDNLFNANTQPNYDMDQGGDQPNMPNMGMPPVNIPPPALPVGPVNPNPASPPIYDVAPGASSGFVGGQWNSGSDFSKLQGSRNWQELMPVFSGLYDEAYAGGGPDKDAWLNQFQGYLNNSEKGFEDYWVQRALGQGAGGADVATSGKYKGQDFGSYEQQHGKKNPLNSIQPVGGADPDISAMLKSILTNGGNFNQGAFQGRLEAARTGLEHQRGAEMDTLSALLAERGLTGSGAEVEGLSRLGGKLGESYGANLQSLFADEASAADERYSDALKLLTSTNEGAAERTLRQYIADQGNELDWNKFLANFGLDREKTEWDWEHSGTTDLLDLLRILYSGAQIGAGGYR